MEQKLYLVLAGLPARGKSTLAGRIQECLTCSKMSCKVFNNGDLRRRLIQGDSDYADFFDPRNDSNREIRERIATLNINQAKEFLGKGGQVAILDATNISKSRRQMLNAQLNDYPLLYIECQNNDQEILEASLGQKIKLSEFAHLSPTQALQSFKKRIAYYQEMYSPFDTERNYLIYDSLNCKILQSRVKDTIPFYDQIRDILCTDYVKNLFLVRHGQTYYNTEDRIGGNSGLTDLGLNQANELAAHFRRFTLPYIFCSQKKRTWQTAEPICQAQSHCEIIPLKEFDEINAGICEDLTYGEIKARYPEIYFARQQDKYNYTYPQGEGYRTMGKRIVKGLKKALFLSGNAEYILIVGHQAVNRMILAHFLYRREEEVPYIYVPQDRYYHVINTQNKKLFELKSYKP